MALRSGLYHHLLVWHALDSTSLHVFALSQNSFLNAEGESPVYVWTRPKAVVLVFLFSSVILLDISSCSSLMLNHHFISHLIISFTWCLSFQVALITLMCSSVHFYNRFAFN